MTGEAFLRRFFDIMNGGALGLMISIGHRTGLFDAMGKMEWGTSDDVAGQAGLDERYVREWLGAMATGKIVEYDAETARFRLPPEHAAFLTRAASPNNLAVSTQFLSVLGAVEDKVVECFRKGGGVPYSAYHRFHDVMAEESRQTVVEALEPHILPLIPGLGDRLSAGIDVLDVGCGSGLALIRMAERFPRSRFTGYDFSAEAVGRATEGAAKLRLANVRFEVRDVTRLGGEERYDLITAFDAIHDQVEPARVLREICLALRRDGLFLMQDIKGETRLEENGNHPIAPYLFTVSCMHCMTVSLSAGGAGLGTMWGRQRAEAMLKEAGFGSVQVRELEHDIINYYYLVRK